MWVGVRECLVTVEERVADEVGRSSQTKSTNKDRGRRRYRVGSVWVWARILVPTHVSPAGQRTILRPVPSCSGTCRWLLLVALPSRQLHGSTSTLLLRTVDTVHCDSFRHFSMHVAKFMVRTCWCSFGVEGSSLSGTTVQLVLAPRHWQDGIFYFRYQRAKTTHLISSRSIFPRHNLFDLPSKSQ